MRGETRSLMGRLVKIMAQKAYLNMGTAQYLRGSCGRKALDLVSSYIITDAFCAAGGECSRVSDAGRPYE